MTIAIIPRGDERKSRGNRRIVHERKADDFDDWLFDLIILVQISKV